MVSNTPNAPEVAMAPMTDSSACLGDGEALKRRANADGYLFIRNLVPRDAVLAARAELLDVMRKHGLLSTDAPPQSGKLDLGRVRAIPEEALRTDIGVSHAVYLDVQKRPAVHRLPHHPALLSLFRSLLDGDVFVHPRHIVRMVTPHPALVPTPVHQDYPLIQGTPRSWTCWMPIGDCPVELGGLCVLRGSHRLGCLPIQVSGGAGNLAAQLCPGENDWVTTDYQAGDALIFPSYTVHKANPCRVPDQVRMSFDVRYQPADEPIEARSLSPHCEASWDELYADWPAEHDDLRYYWQGNQPSLIPYDESLKQPGVRVC